MKNSKEIRKTFLDFFKKRSHQEIPSSPLIPKDDQSILFTNSGMVQFKKCFTGEEKSEFENIVTVQKCLRAGGKHNDLGNVGFTPRHHTFFEMLGNFSFGGYFKEEAIKYAWDLLTKEFLLDKNKLIVTVYKEDETSYNLWKKISGFSNDRVIKISTNDNFWSMGDSGPCGPCSEIFFDNGDNIQGGLPGTADQDGDRFVEIWNLVFMEFQKKNNNLFKLPGKYVDTGMGLERISAVLSNKINNYDTDLFGYIFDKISYETKTKLNKDLIIFYRIISDHIKSIIFMMSEGILPSNEGKGYVLRRIIRRALLNVNKISPGLIILNKLVDDVISDYSNTYYELEKATSFIKKNLKNEEEKFSETLTTGLELLNCEIEKLKTNIFPPEIAFKLYDTYGFPIDMTESILKEKKFNLDIKGYKTIVDNHKKQQKGSWISSQNQVDDKLYTEISKKFSLTDFCGYEKNKSESKLLSIIENNKFKKKSQDSTNCILIFNRTPFYAEAGGQIGDTGFIFDSTGKKMGIVKDVKKIGKGVYLHNVEEANLKFKINDNYNLEINKSSREKIRNNHSATHLLHESLRQIVGKHVTQKGSLVNDKKLRFDYTSNDPLSDEQIQNIEILVNNTVRSNIDVEVEKMPVRKAIEGGAIALFGEKYPEIVRVVKIVNTIKNNNVLNSIELCGGTHVSNTGEIGIFKVLSDTSVSSGIRRVEALTGNEAQLYLQKKIGILDKIKKELKATDDNVLEKVLGIKNESIKLKRKSNLSVVKFSRTNIIKINKYDLYYDDLSCNPKDLRNNVDQIKKNFLSGLIILTTCHEKNISVVVSISENLLDVFDSKKIIKRIILYLGGKGGGGRKDLSQGGAPLTIKFNSLKIELKNLIDC